MGPGLIDWTYYIGSADGNTAKGILVETTSVQFERGRAVRDWVTPP